MSRYSAMSLIGLLVASAFLIAQGDPPGGGLKEGAFLPKPFGCYNFTGEHKGTFHCLVCDYGLLPTVLVFARELDEANEPPLTALLKRLEDAADLQAAFQLKSAVVFLSPDAQSSATNPKEDDPKKLVEEAKSREALYKRLADRAAAFKAVDVAVFPAEGPKGYGINPKAGVTIVFYNKLRVVSTQSFEPGKLTEADIDKLMARVKATLESPKTK